MEATISYLFICKFKAKDPEIKGYTLLLSNILKDFTINNIYIYIYIYINWIKRKCNFFSVDFNPIDTNNILEIHRNLSQRKEYMIMLGVITKMFIVLLSKIVSGSNHTKYTSLSNQKHILS